MQEYPLYINGKWQPASSAKLVDDINPATGEVFARVHQASEGDASLAVEAASAAAPAWAATPPAEREAILLRAADIITAQRQTLVDILVDEAGSVQLKSNFEVGAVVDIFRTAAGECRRVSGETYASNTPGVLSYSIRSPLGVVVGISPFNFPLILSSKKIAFALAAGNTFVLKPSEVTPVIGLKIAELLTEAGLPDGVLNVVPGEGADLGNALIDHPAVKLVTFTGSTRVGKQIAARAAGNLKKCTLELGGKNPLIVLGDADPQYAADTTAFGVFIHQGQICMATSRVIAEETIYEVFCDKLVAKAKGLKVGSPRDPATQIGPLIRPEQCDFIQRLVDHAVEQGARLLTGGQFTGSYYQPTVLADVTPDMEIFHTECFGPVTVVVRAKDHQDALALCNDNHYGLSAAVITNDLAKAQLLSEKMDAGMVHINGPTVQDECCVPFGGIKDSGMGREGGRFSIEEMTELKWVTLEPGSRHYPF